MILDPSIVIVRNDALTPSHYNPPQMGAAVATEDDYDEELPDEVSGKPAWVMPAAIGGGVLVAAGAFMLLRKKKGK